MPMVKFISIWLIKRVPAGLSRLIWCAMLAGLLLPSHASAAVWGEAKWGEFTWQSSTAPDSDGDGVIDSDDAFPDDPAASVDSDDDGAPDAWNAGATEAQIAASSLILDAHPNDALRSLASELLVTVSAGDNGTIAPLGAQVVDEGNTLAVTITADDGFAIDAVDGSCQGTFSGNTFTTDPIVADCDISVSFKIYVAPPRCEGPEPCIPQIIGLTQYNAETMSADVTVVGVPESEPDPLEYTAWCASETLPDYTQLVVESVVNPQDDVTTTIPLSTSGEPPYLCYVTAANGAGSSEQPNFDNYENYLAFNHVTLMAPDDFRETIQGKIQLMYIGLLQRAADRTGLAYWSRTFYNGASVDDIRSSFVPLEEFQSFWGDRTRGEFLNALYRIYFNREPDPEGFEYWNTGGGSGNPVDQLAQIFIDAASVFDQVVLENKAVVASHYTSLYESYDREAVKAVLETVDNTQASVDAAMQTINDNYTAAPPPGPPATASFEFADDFEAADPTLEADIGDWVFYVNAFNGGNFAYGYGPFPLKVSNEQIANISDEVGANQGAQVLNIFSDYSNPDHDNSFDIQANAFREFVIQADDVGVFRFEFDAKRPVEGAIEAPGTAAAFVRLLDPAANFNTVYADEVDTTSIGTDEYSTYGIEVTIDGTEQAGLLIQFGFTNTATDYNASGVLYDNVSVLGL